MRCRRCKKELNSDCVDFEDAIKKRLKEKNHKFVNGNFVYCSNCAKQSRHLNELLDKGEQS